MRLGAVGLLLGAGCAVIHPVTWDERRLPPQVIEATAGVLYGFTPLSWDLPDGRKVLVETHHVSVRSGGGADLSYEVYFSDASTSALACQTEPAGPGVPRTRFGCWTKTSSTGATTFWLAPGADCPARDVAAVRTLTQPYCWRGELTHGGQKFFLEHAYLESTGSPVDRITWTDTDGRLLLAVNSVAELRIEVFGGSQAPPAPLLDILWLSAVAYHWWLHTALGDN